MKTDPIHRAKYVTDTAAKLLALEAERKVAAMAAAEKRRATRQRKEAEKAAALAAAIAKGQPADNQLPSEVANAIKRAQDTAAGSPPENNDESAPLEPALQITGKCPGETSEQKAREVTTGPRSRLDRTSYKKITSEQLELFAQAVSLLEPSPEISGNKKGTYNFRQARIQAAFGRLKVDLSIALELQVALNAKPAGKLFEETIARVINCEEETNFRQGMLELSVFSRRIFHSLPNHVQIAFEDSAKQAVAANESHTLFPNEEVK